MDMRLRKQSDKTGCGIACVAMLANISYGEVKDIAVSELGLGADGEFYTNTGQLRKLAKLVVVNISVTRSHMFKGWVHFQNKAIVAIKYSAQDNIWNWRVFGR